MRMCYDSGTLLFQECQPVDTLTGFFVVTIQFGACTFQIIMLDSIQETFVCLDGIASVQCFRIGDHTSEPVRALNEEEHRAV